MKPSQTCIDFIKEFEGLRLKAYLCSAKIPTIGYGATGPEIKLGLVWTQKQADDRFKIDVERFATGVFKLTGPCQQGQFDAMVSLAFNIGLGAFSTSTLLRKHLADDHVGAANEFARWNKAKKVVVAGLTRRRAAEAELYVSCEPCAK